MYNVGRILKEQSSMVQEQCKVLLTLAMVVIPSVQLKKSTLSAHSSFRLSLLEIRRQKLLVLLGHRLRSTSAMNLPKLECR